MKPHRDSLANAAILNISIHLSIFAFILFRKWLNLTGESFNFLSNVIGLECFDHAEICPTPVMAILWWFQADLLCTSKAWKDHSTAHAFGSTFGSLLNTHEPCCYKKWTTVTHVENMVTSFAQPLFAFSKSKGSYGAVPHFIIVLKWIATWKSWKMISKLYSNANMSNFNFVRNKSL